MKAFLSCTKSLLIYSKVGSDWISITKSGYLTFKSKGFLLQIYITICIYYLLIFIIRFIPFYGIS